MMKTLCLSVLLFVSVLCTAQTLKNFSNDAVKFPEEMKSFLEEANKKESGDALEPFLKAWKEGRFTTAQQEHIYNTANAMLKKRMRPFPDFSNYIVTLASFANSNQSRESFEAWQQSVDKLLKLWPTVGGAGCLDESKSSNEDA